MIKRKQTDAFHLIALSMTVAVAWILVCRLFSSALPFLQVLIGCLLGAVGMTFYLICSLLAIIVFRNNAAWVAMAIYAIALIASLLGVR